MESNELRRRCIAIPAAACGAALGCWYLLQDPGTGPSLGRLAAFALLMRGSHEVNNGALTQGESIALINYMNQILVSLLRLADLVISVTRALASGMRVNEILNTHTTMPDPAAAELDEEPAAPENPDNGGQEGCVNGALFN